MCFILMVSENFLSLVVSDEYCLRWLGLIDVLLLVDLIFRVSGDFVVVVVKT